MRGYTLVEMVIVASITAILAVAAIPFMARSLNNWQLETAAWHLTGVIRMVQQMAMSGESQSRVILFDTGQNLYRVRKDAVIVSETKLPRGVELISVAYHNHMLAFNIQGVPSAAGDIILKGRYDNYYYVRVLPVTGRVKAGRMP